jgi:hypothetical protein
MQTEKQKERLVGLLNEATFGVNVHTLADHLSRETIEKVAEYLMANNVVVLPCKEGSTVYVIKREDTECHLGVIPSDYSCQGCEEAECDSVETYRIRELSNINKWTILDFLWQGRFGKDVFVDRAEAEKALLEKNNV